jgi:hypothetical protein
MGLGSDMVALGVKDTHVPVEVSATGNNDRDFIISATQFTKQIF